MKNIIEVSASDFEREVLHAKRPVILDFYAPWCGPCLMLGELLKELAAEFASQVKFAKVNVDRAPELAVRYQIEAVPTLLIMNHGLVSDTIVGMPSFRKLQARLEAMAAIPAAKNPAHRATPLTRHHARV